MTEDTKNLFYIRPAPEKEWAAELCWRGDDNVYHAVVINDAQLLNFVRQAATIVSERGLLKIGEKDD